MSDLDDAARRLDAIRKGLGEQKKTMQPNECPRCGAFRLDGQPPQLHESWCPPHGLAALGDQDERA